MLEGFKDFIMRGNVIGLAIGVAVGPTFTAIVTVLTDSLLEPLLNAIGGAGVKGLSFEITGGNPLTYLDLIAIITAAIDFLLVAAVVYFVIAAPMSKFNEIREARLETFAEPGAAKADLPTEIRNLLAEQNGKPKTELN